jgi:DNA-binding NarL/FixJ family response regulator
VRLIVVDDHPTFRRTARELLRARGFDVVGEADCCRSALEVAARLGPDGALLDVRLGDDDGYSVCRRLKSARPDLVILLMSIEPDCNQPQLVREVGARAFVRKPDLVVADLERFFTRIG